MAKSDAGTEAVQYLKSLTNNELIQLTGEIVMCPLPEDALARRVIIDLYGDVGPLILVHLISLAIPLAIVLAFRLEMCME